jgi:WD40 repeat protein
VGEGLRRAVVEPAKKQGYRFEDEALVDELASVVEGERGALPLLAFAVARLWEKRDRERELLTYEAYEEIGGVEGALAQHAEATMDRIGSERQGLVREIFRNLVTAQGTRAVIDREELLSAFPDPGAAEEVLSQLIDARLLTSYEVEGKQDEPRHHRVEIVHESLLKAWPRLVRWQAQDEEGALLRDQLKQAAHLWEEKGRTPDLLWSGTAFQEFELWRERYPGQLTALEEDFSRSMVERTRRRRRIRRGVVAAVVVILAAVTAAIAVSRQEAVESARLAEASKLVALAQLRLEEDPTEALALTTASLEVADTREARVFAMKALWKAPPAFEVVGGHNVFVSAFSRDGKWLAAAGLGEEVGVWAETGEKVAVLSGHPLSDPSWLLWSQSGLLVTQPPLSDRADVWSFPGGEKVRTIESGRPARRQLGSNHLFAQVIESRTHEGRAEKIVLRSWRLPDGKAQELGRVDSTTALGSSWSWFSPDGTGWLYRKGRTLYWRPLPMDGRGDQVLSRHDSNVRLAAVLGDGQLVFREASGWVHTCCSLSDGRPRLTRSYRKPKDAPERFYPELSGRWLVNNTHDESRARLWRLGSWPAARPLVLRRKTSWTNSQPEFHPTGDWLVVTTNTHANLTFWPLHRAYPTVVDGYTSPLRPLAFTSDSRSLLTGWKRLTQQLRQWPVAESMEEGPRSLELSKRDLWMDVSVGPRGDFLFAVGWLGSAYVVPLDGSPARGLEGFAEDTILWTAAVSPSGRRVASAIGSGDGEKALRVWDLRSGEHQRFDLPKGSKAAVRDGEPKTRRSQYERAVRGLGFVGESILYSSGDGGIYRWDLESGTQERVFAARPGHVVTMRLGPQGRTALVRQFSMAHEMHCLPVELVDVEEGTSKALPAFGECVYFSALALDASGTVAATGDSDGVVRVGRLGQEEPHLLFGHVGTVDRVAISPDLRWVASAGEDNTLRLWPMPALDQPPLHTLPHEELIAKLKSLTNFRVVRDPNALSGWSVELGPFPGWEEVPEW